MIFDKIIELFINFAHFLLDVSPSIDFPSLPLSDTFDFVSKGLMFFPSDVWITSFVCISLIITVTIASSIFDWVIKKIPGVS